MRQATAPVLVVVDDDGVRKAVQDTLEAERFSTLGARNGGEAIAILERSTPSLILAVPMKNGWQLLDPVSRDQRWAGIPRLVVTSRFGSLVVAATPADRRPFEWGQLISLVREAGATVRPPLELIDAAHEP